MIVIGLIIVVIVIAFIVFSDSDDCGDCNNYIITSYISCDTCVDKCNYYVHSDEEMREWNIMRFEEQMKDGENKC